MRRTLSTGGQETNSQLAHIPNKIREIRDGTCNPLGTPQITTDLSENIILTSLDDLHNWARLSSLWPLLYGTACCFIEFDLKHRISHLPEIRFHRFGYCGAEFGNSRVWPGFPCCSSHQGGKSLGAETRSHVRRFLWSDRKHAPSCPTRRCSASHSHL